MGNEDQIPEPRRARDSSMSFRIRVGRRIRNANRKTLVALSAIAIFCLFFLSVTLYRSHLKRLDQVYRPM